MENLQFFGKTWEFQAQRKVGQYTTKTEYSYDCFELTIRHFFDPMFGDIWACTLLNEPGCSIEIYTGENPTLNSALDALEKELKKLQTFFN